MVSALGREFLGLAPTPPPAKEPERGATGQRQLSGGTRLCARSAFALHGSIDRSAHKRQVREQPDLWETTSESVANQSHRNNATGFAVQPEPPMSESASMRSKGLRGAVLRRQPVNKLTDCSDRGRSRVEVDW